jgi:hypothetical protein
MESSEHDLVLASSDGLNSAVSEIFESTWQNSASCHEIMKVLLQIFIL